METLDHKHTVAEKLRSACETASRSSRLVIELNRKEEMSDSIQRSGPTVIDSDAQLDGRHKTVLSLASTSPALGQKAIQPVEAKRPHPKSRSDSDSVSIAAQLDNTVDSASSLDAAIPEKIQRAQEQLKQQSDTNLATVPVIPSAAETPNSSNIAADSRTAESRSMEAGADSARGNATSEVNSMNVRNANGLIFPSGKDATNIRRRGS